MERLSGQLTAPDPLPGFFSKVTATQWRALSTLHRNTHPTAVEKEVFDSLVEYFLVGEDGELTELGIQAWENAHRYACPWDYSKDGTVWKSCAVIATDGEGNDVLLHACGPAIDYHIDQLGHDLEMLGLSGDEPGPGIWVWEGTMGAVRYDSPEVGVEYEHEARGDWRAPTAEEWEGIKQELCPWDKETLPRWKEAPGG